MAEITYQGLSRVPDDYTCADGQAALSLNLVPENGSLQPIFPPSLIFTLPKEYKVAYIHKTTAFTHYIITRADDTVNTPDGSGTPNPDIYWIDEENIPDDKKVTIDDCIKFSGIEGTEIKAIQAIGNTLIVVTKEAMNYYLWKTDEDNNSDYQYLGTHLPELNLSFGLQGESVSVEEFEIEYDKAENPDEGYWDENNYAQITEQIMAKVNKLIADESTNAGKFMFPFFVRYAFRLYDESLTMHSSPILMLTCMNGRIPHVGSPYKSAMGPLEYDVSETNAKIDIGSMVYTLDYIVSNPSIIADLKNWEDIITSVDIFISAPIYTHDQGGEITTYQEVISAGSAVFKPKNSTGAYYQYRDIVLSSNGNIPLPPKSDEDIIEDIRSCCNFYLLKSYKIDDLATEEREIVDIADDYLQSLLTREVMTDDYDSHDTLVPSFAYNYNNRLDIANIKKRLYGGYNPAAAFCHSDGYHDYYDSEHDDTGEYPYAVRFYVRQDSKVIITSSGSGNLALEYPKFLYIYYPNTNAYKAVITRQGQPIFEVDLRPHDFLNGAFYFEGWDDPPEATDDPQVTSDQTVSVANKLYLSEINNPFFFPVEQIVTVGTGKILGIATAAKPLSQGQFGSFPLYAFCDDGVWALSVNNEGIYSAVQPITRDVCINEKAITQLDSSVLFPTDRGIMQISGNAATCITDVFDSDDIYPIEKLPHYSQLLRLASSGEWDEPFSIVPITDFLSTAVILYDYTNQRIFVCNEGLNYAYVLSIKSQQWGMATVDISSVVNSYPDAYAMTPDGDFVDFTHPDTSAPAPCMYVTRPLKLDGPNVLKTVTAVLQRGFFDRRHVQSAIFGSRDLLHYHTLRTSTTHELRAFAGTPFKYFRLAVLAQLLPTESIFGATVNSIARLTNKAR